MNQNILKIVWLSYMKYPEFQDLLVFVNVRIDLFKKTDRLQRKIMRYTVLRVRITRRLM